MLLGFWSFVAVLVQEGAIYWSAGLVVGPALPPLLGLLSTVHVRASAFLITIPKPGWIERVASGRTSVVKSLCQTEMQIRNFMLVWAGPVCQQEGTGWSAVVTPDREQPKKGRTMVCGQPLCIQCCNVLLVVCYLGIRGMYCTVDCCLMCKFILGDPEINLVL